TDSTRLNMLAADLTAQLDSPSEVARLLAELGSGPRQVLSLFALAEASVWPVAGLWQSLATLGVEPRSSLLELLEIGLLAIVPRDDASRVEDIRFGIDADLFYSPGTSCRLHPSVTQGIRVACPAEKLLPASSPVVQVRESDGLEPIVRLAAIWQRIRLEPLRQTQQGALYKRDQERIDGDPILAGPSSDALEPIPAMPALWLALARRVGLVVADSSGERLLAAEPEFWIDNAVHLPQMIATSWLGLRSWHEWERGPGEPADAGAAGPFLRIPLLLWLATLEDDQWVALDDLAEHLEARNPQWDRLSFRSESATALSLPRRGAGARGKAETPAARSPRGPRVLRSLLLGAALPLGLVRAALERDADRTVVQLTPLGRYVLAMGPPPPPRPPFEHFLFVQPNLEIIAYRQGLLPQLVGRLSRFAWWTKIGAAIELKLSQESVVLGLEAGLSPDQMVDLLARHSHRPLPGLVPDAIGRWASRREQITVYTAASLLEFNSVEERDCALASWSENDPKAFLPVADRFLLVENPQQVPNDRISSKGSRDYRLQAEKCVSIEPDGVTLVLDLTRSDLLIDAELSRFADQLPERQVRGGAAAAVRRYVVSPASLARALSLGITPVQITDWFARRTSEPPSPALKLLLQPALARPITLSARRMLVVSTPTAELADGLIQHPATRDLIEERLGPTSIVVSDGNLETLKSVLDELGIILDEPGT
ncbi:MAG: helicase-associated domain-containing protein, partial [Isosphaeraceae bacterium]